jgi:carboxypeptidase Q
MSGPLPNASLRRIMMIRRNLILAATFGVALTLILVASAPAHSALTANGPAAPADDPMTARLTAVAGTGMYGTHTFDYLTALSDEVGARVTGSPEAARAVQWGVDIMKAMGLENVHAEHYQLWRGWTRESAEAWLVTPVRRKLMVDSMGWVGSTAAVGVDAAVVEVNLNDMANEMSKNSGGWAGKILLVRRMGAAPQRALGQPDTSFGDFGKFLVKAHEAHAIAVIGGQGGGKAAGIHLTHTGILGFMTFYDIPVVSMSSEDQSQLERMLDAGKNVTLHINVQNTATAGPVDAANAVGEIRGTEHPEQIIVVGGHLDSWDLAQGTTDNGCGAATTLGAAEAIVRSGLKPRRTIRFVLFTGEEQGLLGSFAYVKEHEKEMANHLGDIILDAGQGAVTGIDVGGHDDVKENVAAFAKSLRALGVTSVGSDPEFGTDTGPFILAGVPGIGMTQDTSQYGITHHSAADTLDKVDPAILSRNATIEAVLAFWIADMPLRFSTPWTVERTKKMLIDTHHDGELKMFGIWPAGW